MLTRIFKGRRADDALFDQFCQSIEDLHAEKANLCEANDALAKENRNLRLEGQINRAPNIDGMYGEGCRCQSCGLLYVGDLVVPDDVWEVIKPDGKPPGAGMMCASCIMSRIRCRGLWSAGYAFDAAIVGTEPAAVEALAEKHDALAAHIERISAYKDHLEAKGLMPARMAGIIEEAPATSLARRDAAMKAEALEVAADQIRSMHPKASRHGIAAHLYTEAETIRLQAEPGNQ